MAVEHVAVVSLNYDENTYDPQSTCYETVLKFHIWLKEMFCNSICLALMENQDESAAVLTSGVFGTH